uniref:Uncharacterized protein n=1 Tax=Anguilla anguilla TaxID=7936 RepID=A0A0E9V4Y1_ANGAN
MLILSKNRRLAVDIVKPFFRCEFANL